MKLAGVLLLSAAVCGCGGMSGGRPSTGVGGGGGETAGGGSGGSGRVGVGGGGGSVVGGGGAGGSDTGGGAGGTGGSPAGTGGSSAGGSGGMTGTGTAAFSVERVTITGVRGTATPAATQTVHLVNRSQSAVQVTALALSGADQT